jgi:integrase
MPLLTSKNPKYRRHRPTGQAVVTLSAKDFYLGPYGTRASRAEYDRLVGEWLANGRRLAASPHSSLTILELIRAFWRHAKAYYGTPGGSTSAGELGCFKVVLRMLRKTYGHTLAKDFGPLSLAALRESMLALDWSRPYLNAQVKRLRRVFKWGVSQEMVEAMVLEALRSVDGLRAGRTKARETEPVKPVPESDLEATRSHLSPTVRDMVDLQLLTGMRAGELCAMRGCDIDTSGDVWTYQPTKHKTQHHGHTRTVYLGPKAKEIVRKYLRPDVQAYLFSPAAVELERREAASQERKANRTPLSCGNVPGSNRKRRPKRHPGARYDVASYRRAIARACQSAFSMPAELQEPRTPKQREQAQTEGRMTPEAIAARRTGRKAWRAAHVWHPHQLRHNAATRLRRDYGLEVAQVLLGHKTLSVTQIYAEKNVAAAQRVTAEAG